jgi:hypothetical protein
METCLILSKDNQWLSITVPKGLDPLWMNGDIFYYSAMFVACQERGFSQKKSGELAEALVNRRLYPGIVYHTITESELSLITGEQHDTP